jgi:hypothetical protein
MLWFLNIFAESFNGGIGFFVKNTQKVLEKNYRNISSQRKTPIFFAKTWVKSLKIVTITSTPSKTVFDWKRDFFLCARKISGMFSS